MESIASNMPSFGDLTNIDHEKLQDLETVLTTILALPIARDTFAQVIEGTPIRTPFSDEFKRQNLTFHKTIIVGDNLKPSHEAVQKFDEIKTAFVPQDLIIELKLAQRCQDAPRGSREYLLHLLEIAAASVHALAASLYASSHNNMEIKPPEPPGGCSRLFDRTDAFYVNFYHTNYKRFKKYPFGLLDVVGYWAEAEIFGGVVLFEHEGGIGITNAFLHPQKADHAFQLSETQLQSFADLSRPGDAVKHIGAETLLPFAQEPAARTELTIIFVGDPPLRIYKNEYDQPPVSHYPRHRRCVREPDELPVSIREAIDICKNNGWLDQRRAPSTEETAPLSKDDQPSVDK